MRSSGRSGRWAGSGRWPGRTTTFATTPQEKIKYAIDRYVNETNRLYGVLNKRLADREFIAGDYSIADMASYPWVVPYKNQGQNIDDFPHLKRWLETIRERPATVRAYALAKEVNPNFGQPAIRTEEERKLLFGQTARGGEVALVDSASLVVIIRESDDPVDAGGGGSHEHCGMTGCPAAARGMTET